MMMMMVIVVYFMRTAEYGAVVDDSRFESYHRHHIMHKFDVYKFKLQIQRES